MNIIKPSYKIFDLPDGTNGLEVTRHIERIGRLCYKSEDKITDDSSIEFVGRLWNRWHTAMLEHYIFILNVPETIFNDLTNLRWYGPAYPDVAEAMKYIRVSRLGDLYPGLPRFIVSGSLTAFINAYRAMLKCGVQYATGVEAICEFLQKNCMEAMMLPNGMALMDRINDINGDGIPHPGVMQAANGIQIIPKTEMANYPGELRLIHDWYSILFTVDRGVTHEMVRHRDASWAMESTRYCNYSKGKYGNQLTMILPSFFDTGMGLASNSLVYDEWKRLCEHSERSYIKLTDEYHASAQQARTILPHSIKADLCFTARCHSMCHFFNMRAATDAHPQMREVVVPLLKELAQTDVIFRKVVDEFGCDLEVSK